MSLNRLVARTPLFDLQPIIKDYLWTDEYFRKFAILTEDKGDIASDVAQALQGLLKGPTDLSGCSIIVQTCSGGGPLSNAPSSQHMKGTTIFIVVEFPLRNREAAGGTGEPGLVVAEMLICVMKRFQSSEMPNVNFRDEGVVLDPPDVDLETGLTIHKVTMHMNVGSQDKTPIVETPVITDEGSGFVSILSATVNAEIWFTTDGSRPTWQHGTVYAGGNVLVGAGVEVKARAYFTGMRASLIGSLIIGEGGVALTDDDVSALSNDDQTAVSP